MAVALVHFDGGCASQTGQAWRGGRRLCVVFRLGRKTAHLLDVGTLDHYRVARADFAAASIPVAAITAARRRRIARRIEAKRRQLGWKTESGRRRRVRLARQAIDDALAVLR